MKKIPLSQIEDGMILGTDVLDDNGNVLLGVGTSIGEKHKGMLSRRGIENVVVTDPEQVAVNDAKDAAEKAMEAEAGEEELSDAAKKQIARIEHAFSDVLGDPNMRELYRLSLKWARKGAVHE
ncbi:MAG: hypothetical protein JXR97_04870 [Planctomycetes bacterium]|nr:hypothetical protein [Planctomycetota bacterium]